MKKDFKRIVIKIGTSLLASPAGELTLINLNNIVKKYEGTKSTRGRK